VEAVVIEQLSLDGASYGPPGGRARVSAAEAAIAAYARAHGRIAAHEAGRLLLYGTLTRCSPVDEREGRRALVKLAARGVVHRGAGGFYYPGRGT